jgi:hypothetical protein
VALSQTSIYSSLYDRAASSSDGAALRLLVGSIFPAEQLGNLSGKTLPYLVWRPLGGDGQSGEMVNTNAGWYAYIAPMDTGGVRKLTTIADAVYELYKTPFPITGGRLACLAPRAPFFDEKLSLRGIHIPFYYRRLG